MSQARSADDFWPEIVKLPHAQQLRLAQLALKAAAMGSDAAAYAATPVGLEEFTSDEDSLAWDAEGWEEFSAKA